MTTQDLISFVQQADVAYYTTATPICSDADYDAKRDELNKRDATWREKIAAVQGKVDLPINMASLDKIRDDPSALKRFLGLQKTKKSLVIMDKLDGNSGLLAVSSTGVNQLYSRGDGIKGQSLSHMLPYIAGVPRSKAGGDDYFVRGELIISREDWSMNPVSQTTNARNYLAGLLHRKMVDSEVAGGRIRFVAYSLFMKHRLDIGEQLNELQNMGFDLPWSFRVADASDASDASELSEKRLTLMLEDRIKSSKYDVDGLVLAFENACEPPSVKNPKLSVAFKSAELHETATVTVKIVEWNASKDSYLKPVVHFCESKRLSGVMVSRATGINAAFIEAGGIGPGAVVEIIRSGDVIPKIIRVVSPSPTGAEMPGFPWTWNETMTDAVLDDSNVGMSDQVIVQRLLHLVTALGVKGVGPGLLTKMVIGGITTPSELFSPDLGVKLGKIPGFGAVTIDKVSKELLDGLARADAVDLAVGSNEFGRGVGMTKLSLLFSNVQIQDMILSSSAQDTFSDIPDIPDIPGIGQSTTRAFINGLSGFFAFLNDVGINLERDKFPKAADNADKDVTTKCLLGQTFVFSGFRDEDLDARIISVGGRVIDSISSTVTQLVVKEKGTKKSQKIIKADKLGITVSTREEFEKYMTSLNCF